MRTPLSALLAAVAISGLAGCTDVPIRTAHPMQAQPELLSNTHWRSMATDTGFKLAQHLREEIPDDARFYVQGHASYTDFDRIFRNGLAEELRRHDYAVVPTKAQATHQIAYGTRVSDHDIADERPFGKVTLLTSGLWGLSELAQLAPPAATAVASATFLDLATDRADEGGLSEITVAVTILGPEGAEITRETTYYVARRNIQHYPELAMPPLYAAQGRSLPEPPVARFAVE
ncbi:hypothetical protein [Roseospira goensis]|uniref:DUF3313 domain-containing protein n=1 Tax=Roseospira goensis TaxID=391922 RepID=A0A7W6RXP8_9PROT|nr:hypothetical protein [Roseospira goensis]MBB4284650.1 hypothetical protein [Roseospira goensis]